MHCSSALFRLCVPLLLGVVCLPSLLAAPKPASELESLYTNVQRLGNAYCMTHRGWHVAILPDADGKACGILLTAEDTQPQVSTTAIVQSLCTRLGMGTPKVQDLGNRCYLASCAKGDDVKHLFDGSPLEAVAYLQEKGYYHIESISQEGVVTMVSGKKRSIDVEIPLSPAKLTAVRLLVGVDMSDRAANVLADKLGYPDSNGSAADKKKLKSELKCKEVYYLNRKRQLALVSKSGLMYFGEKDGLSAVLQEEATLLDYPRQIAKLRDGSADKETTSADAKKKDSSPSSAEGASGNKKKPKKTGESGKPLTPREALEDFIRRMDAL